MEGTVAVTTPYLERYGMTPVARTRRGWLTVPR